MITHRYTRNVHFVSARYRHSGMHAARVTQGDRGMIHSPAHRGEGREVEGGVYRPAAAAGHPLPPTRLHHGGAVPSGWG